MPGRKRLLLILALVLLVGASFAGIRRLNADPAPPPAALPCPAPDPDRRHARLEAVGGSVGCVGYSDAAGPFATGNPGLTAAEKRVFDNNARADRLAREKGQVVFTVVYLGQLTGIPNNSSGYAADSEELNGLAVAQKARLDSPSPDLQPLLRVVIASAGYQMRYAERVAGMIVDLAAADPTVLAVIGLVESRKETGDALRILQRHGLAAIAPTLSADQMTDERPSNFYLQVAATNHAESKLITAYLRERATAKDNPVTAVRLYYTTAGKPLDEDWYVKSLKEDLEADLGALPGGVFAGGAQPWTKDTVMPCDPHTAVVFAGRWNDFNAFLEAVGGCPTEIVADDSVTRYMASTDFRSRSVSHGLTYVSKGYLSGCDALKRDHGGARSQFLTGVRSLGVCVTDTDFSLGERLGLAYDAAMLLAGTVDRLLDRMADQPAHLAPVTSMAVYGDIVAQHGPGGQPYIGVTGMLTFSSRGAPVDRVVSLVRVGDITKPVDDPQGRPREVFRCGRALGTPAGCRAVRSPATPPATPR